MRLNLLCLRRRQPQPPSSFTITILLNLMLISSSSFWSVESSFVHKIGLKPYGHSTDASKRIDDTNDQRTEFVRTSWSEASYTKLRTFSK
ncbi:unnamed protein product [Anisakis simplex]|uniref:Secreted protein n=1 Tax=Anisakis simplex TaxID=6269 RepID=A0A0M3K247_ANISI|nr:unnamed protein product [Anisakis simplex]